MLLKATKGGIMKEYLLDEGRIAVVATVKDDGRGGLIEVANAIKGVGEKIHFFDTEKRKLIKQGYFEKKGVSMSLGMANYNHGDLCVMLDECGISASVPEGDRVKWHSLNAIVNELFDDMETAYAERKAKVA
jgi:hypothetical protein